MRAVPVSKKYTMRQDKLTKPSDLEGKWFDKVGKPRQGKQGPFPEKEN